MRVTPRRTARAFAAGVLSVALLTAGGFATTASAATEATTPPGPPVSTAIGEITFKATPTEVKAGEKVTFTGRSKGLPIGTKVVLQHKYGSKWTTLHASTLIKQGSSYQFDNAFRNKGREELRLAAGDVFSPTVTVTVR
ncbi:hypothetical protein [Streptomyces sp. NBC_00096]|uniref:hypothetical protein n=1 Tax=Streptomyces sp. NBC_00096 TaxID=2975650 RepID=UPI003244327C